MIAQAQELWHEETLSTILRTFGNQSPTRGTTPSTRCSPSYHIRTPSPDPIPIPPQLNTPTPQQPISVVLLNKNFAPTTPLERNSPPPAYTTPVTPGSDTPAELQELREGRMEGNLGLDILIPDPGNEDDTIPPRFVLPDLINGFPSVIATYGPGCPTHRISIRARADPYPHPLLTTKDTFLFQEGLRHTKATIDGGPQGGHSPAQGDYEAFQVARWAQKCFIQSFVPITHPGGRGIWDVLARSLPSNSTWTTAYVFQRLIDISALHPAGHKVAIQNLDNEVLDIPESTRTATSTWQPENQQLLSFCVRLHRAFLTPNVTKDSETSISIGINRAAVTTIAWDIQADLSSVTDLSEGTQMLSRGPLGAHSATKTDFEAFQVARWALTCFVQPAVPITHPGGRGTWDARPTPTSEDVGWTNAYVLQRLLEIAALHPATWNVPILGADDELSDAPAATLAAISSWKQGNQRLFSFCFRLYRALKRISDI
ncbi:hypothetical protein F5148DRAFT_569745 [Russula earlei]|uniref:Uncharacterized protein n=1 Tax=Russula earlei TaxID=71964 RepID=A0ACC0UFG6_9AGAM|nr:hypothetical protein F5148DRAFT_569745 [Russula earlei]